MNYLDFGQMITGKYGRRYLIRGLVYQNSYIQIYEASEAGKFYLAVVVPKATLRIKTEFVEPLVDVPIKSKEFFCPNDVFNIETKDRKLFGYMTEYDSTYKPVDNFSKYTMEQKLKIGYGICKSFSKLHLNGMVYNEVPIIFIKDDLTIKLLAIPFPEGAKFSKVDVIGIPGITAPELFAVAAVRMSNVSTDRFLLSAMLFQELVGKYPFVETNNENLAYLKFIGLDADEVMLEKFGHGVVSSWRALGEDLQLMFKRSFREGVSNIDMRYDPDDWAKKFQDFFK